MLQGKKKEKNIHKDSKWRDMTIYPEMIKESRWNIYEQYESAMVQRKRSIFKNHTFSPSVTPVIVIQSMESGESKKTLPIRHLTVKKYLSSIPVFSSIVFKNYWGPLKDFCLGGYNNYHFYHIKNYNWEYFKNWASVGREVGGGSEWWNTWLIHVDAWQKPPQYYTVIILQLK